MVPMHDGHPRALSFLSTITRVPGASLEVTRFGKSGDLGDIYPTVYRYDGIDTDSIVRSARDLTE